MRHSRSTSIRRSSSRRARVISRRILRRRQRRKTIVPEGTMHFRLLGLRTAFIVLATVDAVVLSAQQAPGYRYDVVTRIGGTQSPFMAMADTTPSVAHVVTTAKAWRMDQ